MKRDLSISLGPVNPSDDFIRSAEQIGSFA